MRVEKYNSTMFKAKFVNFENVGKALKDRHGYSNQQVSFVKIDPFNSGDINALESASKCWVNDKLALNIYYAACAIRNKSKYYKNHEVYALTSQSANYENIKDDDILGLIQVSPLEDKSMFIERFQVDPDLVNSMQPKFKGIGTAILNMLKQMNDKISCFPSSEKSVKDFYIKNGFKKSPDEINYYVWQKNSSQV